MTLVQINKPWTFNMFNLVAIVFFIDDFAFMNI